MDLSRFREKYPSYGDLDDQTLFTKLLGLYEAKYSDMPFEQFAEKVGIVLGPQEQLKTISSHAPSPGGVPQLPMMPSHPATPTDVQAYGGVKTEPRSSLLEAIPLIGTIVGGVGGGPPGAAGGYLGGAAVKEALAPDVLGREPEWNRLIPGGEDFGESLVMGGLQALPIEKAFAPFKLAPDELAAGKVATAKFAKWVKDLGLPISPKEYAKTRLAHGAQWIAEILPTGKSVVNHYRKNLLEATTRMFRELAPEINVGKPGAATKLVKGIKRAGDVAKREKELAYNLFKGANKGGELVPLDGVSGVIDDILKNNSAAVNKDTNKGFWDWLQRWGRTIEGGAVSWDDLNQFQKEIWSVTPDDMYYLGGKIHEALYADLNYFSENILKEASGRLGDSLRMAKGLASAERQLKGGSPVVQTIFRTYGSNPKTVIYNAFNEGNIDALLKLRSALVNAGEGEAWEAASAQFLQNILEASTVYEKNVGYLNPIKFTRYFKESEGVLKAIFPERFEDWKRFAEILEKAAPDLGKVEKTVEWSMGQKILAGGLGAGAAASQIADKNLLLASSFAVPYGFSALVAQSLMNPSGWLREWLTTGTMPKVAGALQQLPKLVRFADKNERVIQEAKEKGRTATLSLLDSLNEKTEVLRKRFSQ